MSNFKKIKNQHLFKNGYVGIMVCLSVSVLFLFGLGFISYTNAGMLVYPAKDQSPEQQQKDEFERHQWAVQQTGYDPTTAQQAPQQQTTQGGGVARGAAGGALVGVGVGAIAGDPVRGRPLAQLPERLQEAPGKADNGNNNKRQISRRSHNSRPRLTITTRRKVSA